MGKFAGNWLIAGVLADSALLALSMTDKLRYFVSLRRGLGFLFEDFAEVGGVFVAQPVRNFLDGQIGEGEQPLGL